MKTKLLVLIMILMLGFWVNVVSAKPSKITNTSNNNSNVSIIEKEQYYPDGKIKLKKVISKDIKTKKTLNIKFIQYSTSGNMSREYEYRYSPKSDDVIIRRTTPVKEAITANEEVNNPGYIEDIDVLEYLDEDVIIKYSDAVFDLNNSIIKAIIRGNIPGSVKIKIGIKQ